LQLRLNRDNEYMIPAAAPKLANYSCRELRRRAVHDDLEAAAELLLKQL
jgi:hypothetical protein